MYALEREEKIEHEWRLRLAAAVSGTAR